MSRHRNVRNLTEEDYYDYDDDYYDDYDDDYDDYGDYSYGQQQQQQKQKQQQQPQPQKQQQKQQQQQKQYAPPPAPSVASIAVATATATAKVNVNANANKGKPKKSVQIQTQSQTQTQSNAKTKTNPQSISNVKISSSGGGGGISKPPPGWGKPATTNPPSTSKSTSTSTSISAGGISKPPPGWSKPISSDISSTQIQGTATTTSSNNGSGSNVKPNTNTNTNAKSSVNTTSNTTSNSNSTPSSNSYKPKAIPDVLKQTMGRSQLSMVVLGHVDAGKSTLMGQLLIQVGQVTKRDAQKIRNNDNNNISWLLDETDSERERGVTMEIGTKGFSLQNHDIVILDAPGHADFIPIMITGAANADVAILVVAAVNGEFEAGFERGGQTKEHVLLARGLGVSQLIVAINKLDVQDWSQTRFQEIQEKILAYLKQQQFPPKRIQFVPLSGLTGQNVKTATDPQLLQWYKNGPTLLDAINKFQPAKRQLEKPLRFIVTDVYAEGKGVITRGRVIQGFLELGERIAVLPIGDVATVSKLEHLQPPSNITDARRLAIAMAGDTVELVLQGIDIMRISVGNILCNLPNNARPSIAKRFQAKVFIMEHLAVPIIKGAQIIFHMHSLDVPAVMNKLIAITNRDGSIKKERPRALPSACNANVEITLSDRLVLETYTECRALGRFVLRRGGDTIAVGVIDKVLS